MKLKLHANATTTPKTRAYIRNSNLSVRRLASEPGISQRTVARWKARDQHRPLASPAPHCHNYEPTRRAVGC